MQPSVAFPVLWAYTQAFHQAVPFCGGADLILLLIELLEGAEGRSAKVPALLQDSMLGPAALQGSDTLPGSTRISVPTAHWQESQRESRRSDWLCRKSLDFLQQKLHLRVAAGSRSPPVTFRGPSYRKLTFHKGGSQIEKLIPPMETVKQVRKSMQRH